MTVQRKSSVWTLALPCLLALASCSSAGDGEVIVVVTTDMSLPSDIDWLDWSETPLAHPEKEQHGGLKLGEFNALPATLGIASGPAGAQAVVVELDARTGGATGDVRVHREAQVTIPADGIETLTMPLSWLCSDTNLPVPCPDGQTCQAGKCVSSKIVKPLTDYLPLDTSRCFETKACSLSAVGWRTTIPNVDAMTHHCIMDPNTLSGVPVNVALVVNTPVAGNAGICAAPGDTSFANLAQGECFVPLNQDNTAEGWHLETNTDGRKVIVLPTAVCDDVARHTIQNVAVTPAGDCPIKSEANPLCDAPGACVDSRDSCPETDPTDSWFGYSCSGAVQPKDPNPKFYCWRSDTDPEIGSVARGHFCCTTGQPPSQAPLLIDDMSGGPVIKLAPPQGLSLGSWFTASDDTDVIRSPLSPPQHQALFTYQPVQPPVTPPGGPTISSAACFSMSKGFSGDYALEGFNFAYRGNTTGAEPLDVSPYTGITFWATLSGFDPLAPQTIRLNFPDANTDTEHTSSCWTPDTGSSLCDAFGKDLIELVETAQGAPSQWQQVTVPWTDLKQTVPDWGYTHFSGFNSDVYSVDFQANGPGTESRALPFKFCVSQIYFTQ